MEETLATPDAAPPAAPGELVWAKAKGHPWWPARVLEGPSDAAEVLVSYFGAGPARRRAVELRRFAAPGVDEMARWSRGRGFVEAVDDALAHAAARLRAELTCGCARRPPPEGGGGGLGIANLSPSEFLTSLLDAAVDVSTVGLVDCARLKCWSVAFGEGWGAGGAGFYARRAVAELVDRIDLDVPPGEDKHGGWTAIDEGLERPSETPRRKKRSVAALIEKLDAGEDGKENEGRNLGGSVKRERKKSKYLSPPYTNLSGLVLVQKLSEGEGGAGEGGTKGFTDNVAAAEVLLMLRGATRDVLNRHRWAKGVKVFLDLYRRSMFVEGADYETYKVHRCEKENVSAKADTGTPGLGSVSCAASEHGKSVPKRSRKKHEDGSNKSALKTKKKDKASAQAPLGLGVLFTSAIPIGKVKAEDIRKVKVGGDAKRRGIKVCDGKNASVTVTPNSAVVFEQGKPGQEWYQANHEFVGGTPMNGSDAKYDQSAKGHGKSTKEAKNSEADIGADTNVESIIVDVPIRSGPVPMDGNRDHTSVEAAEHKVEGPYVILKAMRPEMLKEAAATNGKNVTEMSHKMKDESQKGRPSQKKKKKKKETIDGGNAYNFPGKRTNGACPDVANSAQKKKKKTGQHFGNPAALLLEFTPGVVLPSKEELLSAFGKFGFLIETETEIVKDTRSARVVFGKSTDAEAAYNSAETLGQFGPPFATPRLHYLPPIKLSAPSSPSPASKPPLVDIRKNLEKMISSLTGPSSFKKAASPDGPKPIADNLVGEMQGLLAKVDKMLSGPSSITPP